MRWVWGSRYLRTLAAIDTAAILIGVTAGYRLPNPLAVMTVIGCITAAATAPFITPYNREQDTRP